MNNGWNKIIQHDSLQRFPLPDNCIDVVITSPPYWGLRDYGKDIETIWDGNSDCEHEWSGISIDFGRGVKNKSEKQSSNKGSLVFESGSNFCSKCGAWHGQLGLEPHPQMYIDHLVMIFKEVKRVLKKSGSFYLNLGDTYYSSGAGHKTVESLLKSSTAKPGNLHESNLNASHQRVIKNDGGWCQPKQLMLIPMRVAIALQDDGWILRNDIIWHKPNPMPSSVKDRLNNTFEHVFHFVKSKKYYYDLDEIREPHAKMGLSEGIRNKNRFGFTGMGLDEMPSTYGQELMNHPLGKNPGDIFKSYSKKGKYKDSIVGASGGRGRLNPYINPEGKNPGDIMEWNWRAGMNRDETELIAVRVNMPSQKEFVDYIKPKVKGFEDKLDEMFGTTRWRHWIRYDESGFAFPSKEDWIQLKWLLELDDTFDLTQTEIKYNAVYNNPKGKAPGDFWDICTQPFTSYSSDLEHFAVFPEELILKPLKASCPKEICKKCGKPRTRIIETKNPSKEYMIPDGLYESSHVQKTSNRQTVASLHRNVSPDGKTKGVYYSGETVGFSDCGCDAGFDAGVVLDPFCGRGTVGKVAKELGLNYVLFDIKPEYCELARLYVNGQKRKLIKHQQKLEST